MKPAGALILAAGMSRRMGSFKPLMEFQGETLIGRVVRSLREAGASPIVVVVGCRAGGCGAGRTKGPTAENVKLFCCPVFLCTPPEPLQKIGRSTDFLEQTGLQIRKNMLFYSQSVIFLN